MALINCPECHKSVSDQARSCPNCGRPIKREEQRTVYVIQRANGRVEGYEEFSQLQRDGWQVISEHDEADWDGEAPFTRVVYQMRR